MQSLETFAELSPCCRQIESCVCRESHRRSLPWTCNLCSCKGQVRVIPGQRQSKQTSHLDISVLHECPLKPPARKKRDSLQMWRKRQEKQAPGWAYADPRENLTQSAELIWIFVCRKSLASVWKERRCVSLMIQSRLCVLLGHDSLESTRTFSQLSSSARRLSKSACTIHNGQSCYASQRVRAPFRPPKVDEFWRKPFFAFACN